ncbi:MAG: Txe/YoeB family addiction module toxin [Chthoniobacterales bacterium]
MNLVFSDDAWEDYFYWQQADPQTLKRIHQLIRDIRRGPYRGIGKPEPLKHALQGYWSRRIKSEHRIVYRVCGDDLRIAQLRHHYRR